MAQITIQDILASDNVGASRAIMMSNFKTLTDTTNKVLSFLDISASGGQLTIADVVISRFNNLGLNYIGLKVESSAIIDGSLTVKGGFDVQGGEGVTIQSDLKVEGVLKMERPISEDDNTTEVSEIGSHFHFGDGVSFEDMVVSAKNTSPAGLDVRGSDLNRGVSNITVDWTDVDTVYLKDGHDGQILIVKSTGKSQGTPIIRNANGTSIYPYQATMVENLETVIVTLIYVENGSNWKVMCVGTSPA